VVSVFQIVMAACFALTLPLWDQRRKPTEVAEPMRLTDYKTPLRETLRHPRVWLSALLFFLYVGAEVSLGTWTYSLLVEARGVNPTTAGFWAGSYWATFTVGRILAGLYAKRIGVKLLVKISLVSALLGSVILVWNPSQLANVIAVALIGFSIAPIFPALISGTSERVGEHLAANTIGMQMTASGLGTAVIPSLLGVLARRFSLEAIPVCLVGVFAILLGFFLLSSQTNQIKQENA
jgi:fucose permease